MRKRDLNRLNTMQTILREEYAYTSDTDTRTSLFNGIIAINDILITYGHEPKLYRIQLYKVEQ